MKDRRAIAQQTHNAAGQLTPANKDYRQWIFRYTFLELEKDLGEYGDITSAACFPEAKNVSCIVVVKQSGVLAGIQEVKYFLVDAAADFRPRIGAIKIDFKKSDGAHVASDDIIMELSGSAADIFAVERVVLNLIGRMSGVATATWDAFSLLSGESHAPLLTPTRKTLWGLLDKRACVLGGGGTHRLSLDDAVLIKHNHLRACAVGAAGMASGEDIVAVLRRAYEAAPLTARFFEVEVNNEADALAAAEYLSEARISGKKALQPYVMLDNMTPKEIASAIEKIKERGWFHEVMFEASGRINHGTLKEYAATGVDVLSAGYLTHSAPMMDVSLRVK